MTGRVGASAQRKDPEAPAEPRGGAGRSMLTAILPSFAGPFLFGGLSSSDSSPVRALSDRPTVLLRCPSPRRHPSSVRRLGPFWRPSPSLRALGKSQRQSNRKKVLRTV